MSQRMLRGMAAGLGALVSLGSMAGCGTDGQVQKATSIKIGVTVYDQYDTFVSQMMTDFNEYAAEQEEQTGIAINVEVYNAAGRIRMLIRTVTVSSSMWCWREKPGIRMRSCAPSMRSQRL